MNWLNSVLRWKWCYFYHKMFFSKNSQFFYLITKSYLGASCPSLVGGLLKDILALALFEDSDMDLKR